MCTKNSRAVCFRWGHDFRKTLQQQCRADAWKRLPWMKWPPVTFSGENWNSYMYDFAPDIAPTKLAMKSWSTNFVADRRNGHSLKRFDSLMVSCLKNRRSSGLNFLQHHLTYSAVTHKIGMIRNSFSWRGKLKNVPPSPHVTTRWSNVGKILDPRLTLFSCKNGHLSCPTFWWGDKIEPEPGHFFFLKMCIPPPHSHQWYHPPSSLTKTTTSSGVFVRLSETSSEVLLTF